MRLSLNGRMPSLAPPQKAVLKKDCSQLICGSGKPLTTFDRSPLMLPSIEDAIALRKAGHYGECRALLHPLLDDPAQTCRAHLHTAWAYDNEGLDVVSDQVVPLSA